MNKLLLMSLAIALAGLISQRADAQSTPADLVSAQNQDDQRGGGLGRTRGGQSDNDDDDNADRGGGNDQDKGKRRKDKRDD